MMKFRLLKLLAILFALGAATIAPTAAAADIDFATYQGADREALLIAAAKKEGELSIYQVYPIVSAVSEAFTKKYGIKVKSWRADSESVLQRIVSESRASRGEVDIVQNSSPENTAAFHEKLLKAVTSPYQKDLIPEAVPPHKAWAGFTLDVYSAAYNTSKMKKEDLPKSYEDLLDPKWKNKLSVEVNDYGWFSTLIAAMGEQKGRKLFSEIAEKNGMSFRKGHSLLVNLIASGEVPIGLSAYSWTIAPMKRKGAPIELLPLQPLVAQFGTVAVLNKAPHPAAAVLFYDFMLHEGLDIVADYGFVSSARSFVSPFAGIPIKIIDPDVALASQEKWKKTYEDILMKNAK